MSFSNRRKRLQGGCSVVLALFKFIAITKPPMFISFTIYCYLRLYGSSAYFSLLT
jgi:hypothetical protein